MKMKRFIGAAAAMAVAGTLTVGAAAETYNAYIGFQSKSEMPTLYVPSLSICTSVYVAGIT